MEALFHIVGCVLAAKPAPELIEAFVAQVRRERAAVLVRSAQGATFVRFGASDAKLVSLAVEAARGLSPVRLRFGFAVGTKEPGSAGGEGLDISTRSIVQAGELAAGAEDGEVLVSPQLAVSLIESGVSLRSKQVPLPGGRLVPACLIEQPAVAAESGSAAMRTAVDWRVDPRAGTVADLRPRARAAGGLAPLSPAPEVPAAAEASAGVLQRTDALGNVFRALLAQAKEIARRQGEVEARQDAVLGKMTLVDEGSVSARHLSAMESELDAQVARVEARLDFIDGLERRVGNVQSVIADVERRLSAQLHRRSEVESLKVLCDTLLAQLVEAQPQLEEVAALQGRLLPMTSQVAALTQTLEDSQRALAAFEGRLGELDGSAEAVERKIESLGEREAIVQAVKAEVDHLREVSERSRADLQFVTERQGMLAGLRAQVDGLLGRVEETDGKINLIESRRQMVEEAQASVSHMTHVLGDIQLKLEVLNEQRVVIEHVGDKLARLDFTVQEAQNTLRALQREREVAERIEQGIKALRARSGAGQPT
ncbi:MAG: hypothetical protein JNN03_13080 [Rubrivivax sp.]|nr:hypothetical protein [Rubrivivax sp.]